MEQFQERFPQVSDTYPGGGFYKGLMTAMITLGALIGKFGSSTLKRGSIQSSGADARQAL